MKNEVLIMGFSNPTKEGITIHLNKETTLKTGNIKNKEFRVSWDKIGSLLFDGYCDVNNVEDRNKLREDAFINESNI